MNIGIASSGLGRVTRGIETSLSALARVLAERGCSVHLYRGAGKPAAHYECRVPSLGRGDPATLRLLRCLPRRGAWRLGLGSPYDVEQTTFALNLLGRLRDDSINVLHVKDPQVAFLMQWANRLHLVRTRTILSHGTEEPLVFLRHFDYLQHQAPWHLEEARAAGVWKSTWTAIPNFTDTRIFRPGDGSSLRDELGIPRQGFVVLTASAIRRRHKRVDFLLTEFDRLLKRTPEVPVYLVVAGGREDDSDELVALGRELLGDRVRFLVQFPPSRMPELYRAADAFVLCSLKEMMPNALLEAMATGLPCLVNRHPVLDWIVGPGGEALDMDSPGALAAALWRLLADPVERRALGARARRYCLEQFSHEPVVDQILAYYRYVLTHRPERDWRTPKTLVTEPSR